MALEVFTVRTIKDVEAMVALHPNPPRRIEIACLNPVRRAPEYLAAIEDKVARGWFCATTPQVARFNRFAELLTALDTNVLYRLANNPTDVTALRDLRSKGKAIRLLRKRAAGQPHLIRLAGYFANSLERAARQALRTDITYQLSEDRVGEYTACVHMCLDRAIDFPEVDPGSDDESSGPSSDGSSGPSSDGISSPRSHAKGQDLLANISGKGQDLRANISGKGQAHPASISAKSQAHPASISVNGLDGKGGAK